MSEAFIVAATRTAGGRRGGRLSGWHPVDLAAQVLNDLVDRTGADPALIERVKATEADLWVGLPFGPRVHWTDDHASILPVLVRPW